MPALDFPANPTNGQVYQNWIYSTSKGAWQAKPLTSAVATPSDTAPLNPDNGDLWYNTTDGSTYVYYVDGTSAQWVQTKSDSTFASTLGPRVDALEIKSPNYIINGGFDIWQRGTTGTYASGSYSGADRWVCGSNSTTISRDTDVPSGISQYSLKIVAGSANSIYQRIESANSSLLSGKTVTLSFYYKRTSGSGNLDARFYYANALDNFSSVTQIGSTIVLSSTPSSSWVRYSTTITLPSNVTNGLQVLINSDGATTSFIDGVQLEEGPVTTGFRRNSSSIAEELATCQRYFYRHTGGGNFATLALAQCYSGTQATAAVPFPVSMRIAPSASFSAASTFTLSTAGFGTATCTGATAGAYSSLTHARCDFTVGSSVFTAGHASHLMSTSGTAFIDFNAEL